MPNILIVGGTRGLGEALVNHYAGNSKNQVYATTRSSKAPSSPSGDNIHWVTDVELTKGPDFSHLANAIAAEKLDVAVLSAGYFQTEEFGQANWDNEVKMYTTSSIAPVFIVEALVKSSKLGQGSKLIIVSSESGSISLRHESEGGGNFAHHGSKAASNMVGKLLSFDLKPKGVAVGVIHPSFMRTEMTKGVGFDKFWDDGGALKPEEAAKITADWIDKDFSMDRTGTYWAPRGTRDIGTWEPVMGKDKKSDKPVEVPW